jgi:single-stranded-DNA-specific exonuclease
VTLKLAHAVLSGLAWPEAKLFRILESFLKLVAIATVADIVPLTGENRIIVRHGLAGLSDARNPGLKALLENSGFGNRVPNATEVGFRIAPAINASGRMDSAGQAVRLFLTSDPAEADRIAKELFALNTERQAAERAIVNEILDRCLATPVDDSERALVFWGEGWHRGVVGIVASRVVERYHRPVFVLGIDEGVAYGSGRSIPCFHLLEALETMPELFTKFGGHRQAAGVTIAAANVDEFRAKLRSFAAARLTVDDFEPVLEADTEADLREIHDRVAMELLELAPFGMGNRAPTIVLRDVELAETPEIKNEKHVFFRLNAGKGRPLRAKAWNFAERVTGLAAGSRVDLAVQIEDDAYSASKGYAPWQVVVKDVKAGEMQAASASIAI